MLLSKLIEDVGLGCIAVSNVEEDVGLGLNVLLSNVIDNVGLE